MASEDAIQLLTLVILIMLSAFFSSAETALTTVNRIRLQALAEEGNKKAEVALKAIDNSSKLLSTILIGNNLVNNFTSALATALAIKIMGNGAVGFVTGVLTIVILVFGEITPKTFAAANAEKLAFVYVKDRLSVGEAEAVDVHCRAYCSGEEVTTVAWACHDDRIDWRTVVTFTIVKHKFKLLILPSSILITYYLCESNHARISLKIRLSREVTVHDQR